jgi:putative transposase
MDLGILEFNGEADYVHVLIEYPPKLSISKIVNFLKGVSSPMYGKAGEREAEVDAYALWSPRNERFFCWGSAN